ncbi:valine--tRNA ligase [archaeon]|nr:valine--tRNA ligase [archaeon]
MLAACVAVFYHPDDKRYQSLNGKKTIVPLYEFSVPIMADKRVDPDKGSGLVMSCTFGDLTDCEWQKQYKLPIKEAIGKDGRMTKISGKYAGMPITKAREAIIEDLQEAKLLVNKKAIKRAVNVHERCGTPIEFIHSKQWFIKYLDLKKDLLKWGRELNWHPLHMKNRYDNWIKGLQWDWCISRQIPFGIPFPVWYCKECDEIILADEKTLPVDPTTDKPSVKACPKCKCKDFVPESDIINTWATSSLTPQIVQTLSSVNPKKLFPMSLRPQAHDIISFWLCNTVVKSQLHHKTNPWKDVAISGWALDPKGKKMSKSKGNIVEPQKIIEQYSADALRYWSASSKLGEDMPFQEKDIITGEKFSNKLWNASNFALSHLKTYNQKEKLLCGFDHWLLSKINTLITNATEQFTQYEYAQARLGVDMFFRQTFCDDYLEIVKDRVYNSDRRGVAEANSGRYTLYHSLLSCLKMIAPIMPHVTEEIYQAYYKKHEKNKSIHITDWPKELTVDKTYEKKGDRAIEIIHKVRKFKTDKQVSMKAPVILTLDQKDKTLLKDFIEDLKAVTSAQEVKFDNTLQIDLVD